MLVRRAQSIGRSAGFPWFRRVFYAFTTVWVILYFLNGWVTVGVQANPLLCLDCGEFTGHWASDRPLAYHGLVAIFGNFALSSGWNLSYAPSGTHGPGLYFIIPLWPLVVVLIAVSLIWYRLSLYARAPAGHCPICHYDLRASPNRCPECGHSNHLHHPDTKDNPAASEDHS